MDKKIVLSALIIVVLSAYIFFTNTSFKRQMLNMFPFAAKSSLIKKELSVVLIKNKKITLEDTDITIELISIKKPPEKCYDCVFSAKFEVRKGSKTENLEFKSGGIKGDVTNELEAFGYIFKLIDVQESSIKIKYSKK